MSRFVIRPARLEDAARLAELSGVLGYPVAADVIASRLSRLIGDPDCTVLVAESGGRVMGWIHGAEHDLLESDRHCEILGLVVDASTRGSGVGRGLVNRVEEWARHRGLTQLAVRSNVVRTESHPFYERIGFTRVKTQHAYRKSVS